VRVSQARCFVLFVLLLKTEFVVGCSRIFSEIPTAFCSEEDDDDDVPRRQGGSTLHILLYFLYFLFKVFPFVSDAQLSFRFVCVRVTTTSIVT